MDELMRSILTEIQAGKADFLSGPSREAIQEFQATAKRISEAQRLGYIADAKEMRGSPTGDARLVVLAVAIPGGLTSEGERALLDDYDERAF
jgi:hypothetical protein